MANVLTSLAADIYKAADIVGRELVGFVNSVTINAGMERAAQGDTVRSFFTRVATVVTPTPSMTIPEGTDQTVDNKTATLDTLAAVQIPWTGEDIKHVNNGAGFQTIYGDQMKQAFRAIVNQIETACWNAARKAASRAYGTAATTPFVSNFNELPQLRKILADNGCPVLDGQLSVVMDTTAGANLRSLSQLQKVNEAGETTLLRQGEISNLIGFSLKESAAVVPVAVGTGTSYAVDNVAGYPAGSTAVTTEDGSGTILAGDVLTNSQSGRDANKYVVGTGITAAGAGLVLNDPGIRKAWVDEDTLAVGAAFTPNVVLHKQAVELAIRPIAKPMIGGVERDLAIDSMIIQDPWSGLVFEIRAYLGYGKAMFDISCIYGVKAWKPQHIALLLG